MKKELDFENWLDWSEEQFEQWQKSTVAVPLPLLHKLYDACDILATSHNQASVSMRHLWSEYRDQVANLITTAEREISRGPSAMVD